MKTKLLYLFLFVLSISYAQVPTNDLISRYYFNASSSTLSDERNDADLTQQGASFTQVLDRHGTNNAISLPANGALQRTDIDITLTNQDVNLTYSFWVKTSTNDTNRRTIIDDSGRSTEGFSGTERGYFIYLKDGKIGVRVRVQNGSYVSDGLETNNIIADGNWHHVVVGISLENTASGIWSLNSEIIIDNVQDGSLNTNYTVPSGVSFTTIERTGNVTINDNKLGNLLSANKYQGEIDDLLIYNRRVGAAGINSMFIDQPKIVYVNANVSGGQNDGTSWANAYTDLRNAIVVSGGQSQLWVAQGTYRPSSTSRTASFNITSNDVLIYGGFDGTETQLNQRDVFNNPTILSGDINGDDTGVAFTGASRGDNSFNVLKINGNGIILDGLQINNGHATGTATSAYGGAILVGNSVNGFRLENCELNNNLGLQGGAIRAGFNSNATVVINNTVFNNNMSRYGAGAYLFSQNNNNAIVLSVDISNCLFSNNRTENLSATDLGITGSSLWIRAISVSDAVTTTVSNCTFANNSDNSTDTNEKGTFAVSRSSGGVHNVAVNNTIFYNNRDVANNVTFAVNRGQETITNSIAVNNCTDEDGFSNLSTGTINILTTNPLFTDAANDDFTLQSGSTSVNTGDNSLVVGTTDLLGNQRIFNTTVDRGAYEFGSSPLSINNFDSEINEVRLYPNPTTSILNIEIEGNLKLATIYSVLGAQVLKTSSKTINTTNFKSGVYLMKIEDETGSITTKRFIKQ